jgi:platelet-activating factor acetylhydrolase
MAIFPKIFPVLPKYPGPYQVGSIDVEISLPESKKFEVTETSVETILVRLFYPAAANGDGKKAASPSWLPQPSMAYAKGYANFLKQPILPASLAITLAVYNTTIPAADNALPITPPNSRFPVMIFSHGLGGSRNTYSQWCGSIASYGVFVAAIEHRDGSASISIVHAGMDKQSAVPYRRITEYNDETKVFRASQLSQRKFEVCKLIGLLRDINHGKTLAVGEKQTSLLEQFKGILNTKKGEFIMAGHSFGAATTVAICKDEENIEADYPVKDEFKAAVMLDIWTLVTPCFKIFLMCSRSVRFPQQR